MNTKLFLTLALLLPYAAVAQNATTPTATKVPEQKTGAVVTPEKSAVAEKKGDAVKPIEIAASKKDVPQVPEPQKKEVTVKQPEGAKDITAKAAPTATEKVATAAFQKKAIEIQNAVKGFIDEAVTFAKATPSEMENVMEELGGIMEKIFVGIEQITGVKFTDFEAEVEKEAQTASVKPEAEKAASKKAEQPAPAAEKKPAVVTEPVKAAK